MDGYVDRRSPEMVETVYRIDASTVDFVIKHIIVDSNLMLECIPHFNEEYFSSDEKPYRIIIKALKFYHTEFNEAPTSEMIKCIVSDLSEVRGSPNIDGYSLKDQIFRIVDSAFDYGKDGVESNRKLCRETLQRFLNERAIHDKLYSQLSSTSAVQTVVKDANAFFNKFTDINQSIQSMNESAMCDVIPTLWKPATKIGDPLGLPYFDKFMTGGTNAGDVYAILGGFGSGKTWMGINVIANNCIREHAREMKCIAENTPYVPKVGIYVNYEGSIDVIRFRLAACLSRIPEQIIKEHLVNGMALSTRETLRAYELRRYLNIKDEKLRVPEVERFASIKGLVNRYTQILDMSGSTPAKLGKGFTNELISQIDKYVSANKVQIGTVCVDYVKLMADRHIAANGNKMENLRHYIRRVPAELSVGIGIKHNCVVWLLHQISGEANSIKPGKALHHSHSSESKDFGENVHRVFCLGQKHEESGVQRMDASKLRSDETPTKSYVVVKFDGETSSFSLDNNWIVDEHAGFVKASYSGSSMDVSSRGKFKEEDSNDRDS
jgi:hypothetical protein